MTENSTIYSVLKKPRVWAPLLVFASALVFLAFFAREAPETLQVEEKPGIKYSNKDLGFSLILPEEYKYFHTQSKVNPSLKDIEVFIPTADTQYPQEVPGYAKSIVVRVYDRKIWDELPADSEYKVDFKYLGIKNDRAYSIKFWNKEPKDWNGVWDEDMKQFIQENFKMN